MDTAIFTEKLVPEVYKESRDFRVFLKLLDMIVSVTRYDIDNWIKLYNAFECPEDFLPLLADFVGYIYSNDFTVSESRVIIDNFVSLIKNRGAKLGFRQAMSVLLNAKLYGDPTNPEYQEGVNQLGFLEIYFDYETGYTSLYFPKKVDYNRDFFNYIRPVGTYLDFIVTEFPEPESDIAISATATAIKHTNFIPKVKTDESGKVIESDDTYRVNNAQVNLSQIGIFENNFNDGDNNAE